jgi:predicted HTH domain antitoxin
MGELTVVEQEILSRAGLVEPKPGDPDAFERTRVEYEQLLRDSLSLEQAAELLGMSVKHVRRRLHERTIYGVQYGRSCPGPATSWHVLRFQFDGNKLVAGIEQVLPRIQPGAHPLGVQSWFTLPHPGLVVGEDERSVSPLDWLRAGRSHEDVAQLAAEMLQT